MGSDGGLITRLCVCVLQVNTTCVSVRCIMSLCVIFPSVMRFLSLFLFLALSFPLSLSCIMSLCVVFANVVRFSQILWEVEVFKKNWLRCVSSPPHFKSEQSEAKASAAPLKAKKREGQTAAPALRPSAQRPISTPLSGKSDKVLFHCRNPRPF